MPEKAYIPPFNEEAEQFVLGAVFVDPACLVDVARILKAPEMFWRVSHQHVYRAMLARVGQEIDWMTIIEDLRKAGVLEACGGQEKLALYLSDITRGLPSAYGVDRYALIVRDRAIKRECALRAGDVRSIALDETRPAGDALDALSKASVELGMSRVTGEPRAMREIGGIVREQAKSGGVTGLQTRWRWLDDITGGFKPGELIVVGARPGRGKSSFVADVAVHQRQNGVLIFSPEMPGESVYPRCIGIMAGVDANLYTRGKIARESEVGRAVAAAEAELDSAMLWIDDSSKLSVQDVRAQAMRWAAKHPLALVIVDYLGLVDATDRTVQRYEQLGEVSRGLKQLARELNIPVIAPHQISREAEKEEPRLSHLRESGNVEQDSDQVIFLHATGQTNNGVTPVDVIVAKNRTGKCGRVRMNFERAYTRFTERVAHEQGPQ